MGAGDTHRVYDKLCIDLDVMIVGPGDPGSFSDHRETYANAGGIGESIRRFYQSAQSGDIVLLRLGTNQVKAVGEIADDGPTWMRQFEDIDGWDLQHVRRVRWFPHTSHDFPIRCLGGQVQTFAQVNVPQVREWVESLNLPEVERTRPLATIPPPSEEIEIDELARRLFVEGLPSDSIERLQATLESIQRVAQWYSNPTKRPEGRPSESETVCYLVVPLLLSLGWSQQTAAIEWRNIDVALFGNMPPSDQTLRCVIEAKTLTRSVFQPFGQARSYALKTGREGCIRLIVTDGIRYAIYRREGNEFTPYAYLNLLRMRERHPLYGYAGAVEAILEMSR